jgi:hypothetical protein
MAVQNTEIRITRRQINFSRLYRSKIPVKRNQATLITQAGQNQPAMPASPECSINIDSIRLDRQRIHSLIKQHGNVIRQTITTQLK